MNILNNLVRLSALLTVQSISKMKKDQFSIAFFKNIITEFQMEAPEFNRNAVDSLNRK